jgi:hypothetical protein
LEEGDYWDKNYDWTAVVEHLLPDDIVTYLCAADVFMSIDLIWTVTTALVKVEPR